MAVRASSVEPHRRIAAPDRSRTRIAGCSEPATRDLGYAFDLREPLRDNGVRGVVDARWPRMVLEVSARMRIGAAAGLDLRNVGSVGRSLGRSVGAALRAACTSRAAPSMLRDRSNWTLMRGRARARRVEVSLGGAGDLAELALRAARRPSPP